MKYSIHSDVHFVVGKVAFNSEIQLKCAEIVLAGAYSDVIDARPLCDYESFRNLLVVIMCKRLLSVYKDGWNVFPSFSWCNPVLPFSHFLSLKQCWAPWGHADVCAGCCLPTFSPGTQSVQLVTMAFAPAPSPTVVDQTTLMKKYLQFVAALTDANTRKFIDNNMFCLWSWSLTI